MISREVSQSGKITRLKEETEEKGKVSNREVSYSSSTSLTIFMRNPNTENSATKRAQIKVTSALLDLKKHKRQKVDTYLAL
ncbi:hypothetical protein LYNGBM3L_20460 [Moorena producens 3L]|uniref:Uncharacterized protein n=1 Tax=Moorena producens 3L TaxID=489825 RepID=F4XMR6_9CYAN|nr:hypothetical protein LYNGBM3L_20460 [Moorena producens 3L]